MSFVTPEQIEHSPSGVSAFFVRMGSSGMKVYRDSHTRDACYGLQRLYHSHGLAPFCHFRMEFDGPDGQEFYAFFTDVAECRTDSDSYEKRNWWGRKASEVRIKIKDKLGYDWFDDHGGNVGLIDGEFVCIDCDPQFTPGSGDDWKAFLD